LGYSSFNDVTGNGLRILLLGSYDSQTKSLLRSLRNRFNEIFARYECFTILLENLDVYVSTKQDESIIVLFDREDDMLQCTIIKENKIEETIDIPAENFENYLGSGTGVIAYNHLRKITELEKINTLSTWSDLIIVIKHLENTRGGELVELTYLLFQKYTFSNMDPFKYIFLHQKDMFISTMVNELLALHKVNKIQYKDEADLLQIAISEIQSNITRLNLLIGRFKEW
jgi:hypothetical protein